MTRSRSLIGRGILRAAAAGTALLAALALISAPAAGRASELDARSTALLSVPAAPPSAACVDAPSPSRYAHVIWIVMENKPADRVIGTSDTPRLTSYAESCARVSGYHAVTHPSLPNYLALVTGSTHGVTDDAQPSAHPISGPSIFSAAAKAGRSWWSLAESMPQRCARTSSGRYAVKHNPLAYLTRLRDQCAAHDRPLGTVRDGALASALASGRLPAFTLVIPDMCNDTHDCSVATGDAWLGRWLHAITSSQVYRAGRTAVFVTWDEDDNSADNVVALVALARAISPGTVAHSSTRNYTHLSLLATTLDLLGVPRLRRVADHPSLRRPLGL